MKTVVLFTCKNSIYNKLDCETYDINRDARTYTGNKAVIAHPPCRAWGKLKAFANPRIDEKDLAVFAIDTIRKNGGILEHPAGSSLFTHMNIPLIGCDKFGGYVIKIRQSDFGHRAEKKTLLYVCGISKRELPQMPISFERIDYCIGKTKNSPLKYVNYSEREATPVQLAKWLIEIVKIIEQKKNEKEQY